MCSETAQQADWDGRPESPERSGWHWVEDGDGVRPLLWRGGDWPEPLDRGEWQDGFAVISPYAVQNGRYHGPLAMPPSVAVLFSLRLTTRSI